MEYIAHRINTTEQLIKLSPEYGVELDLRDDLEGKVYIAHNPFEQGEDFEQYLKHYNHKIMILNIKSERIELKVLELLKQYHVKEFFFLDSSFPMIYQLVSMNEQRIALRYSEFEGMDTIRNMRENVKWIWVDCFTKLPITRQSFKELKGMGYKLCLVSPELQGRAGDIEVYGKYLKDEGITMDAICTKEYNIEKWKSLLAAL